jgi:tyrosine-protein kinase Etk/Wzc
MEEPISIKKPSFDIKNYILKMIAFWYLFAISVTLGFIYNTIDNRFIESNYSINCSLILNDDLQNTQAIVGGLKLFDNRKNYENEFGVLKSYKLNELAIKELDFTISYFKEEFFRLDIDLYKNTPFIIKLDSSKPQTEYLKCNLEFISADEFIFSIENTNIREKLHFGQKFNSDYLSFTVTKNDSLKIDYNQLKGNRYYFYKNNLNGLVREYQEKLNVDLRSPNSSILWLWTDGPVPERIVDYINKLVDIYIKNSLEDKNRVVKSTIAFIDIQLEGVIDSLSSAEDRLKVYKQNNKILDIGKEGEMLFKNLDDLEKEKKILELKKAFYQYQLTDINNNGKLTSTISPAFLDIQDAILESLIIQYQQFESEKEVLGYDVKKDFPNVDILNLKAENILKEIKSHINNTLKAIEQNTNVINQKMAIIDTKLRQIPNVERELKNFQRRFDLNDNIYTFLLEKRTEAGITMSSNSPGAKRLDVARYENVVKNSPLPGGNRNKILIISILIPILFISIKDFFNNKIIDKSDIEKTTNIPILGSVCRNMTKDEIPVHNCPNSPVSESFRLVKANFKYLLIEKKHAVISINSTTSGEGKSFCSVNVAALLAHSNKRTLIMGLDLRKPKVHLAFNHPNVIGLSNVLIGENEIEEVIYETHIKNLYLIPSGRIPINPAELIESDKMQEVIENLKSKFDYIVFDTPPLAHVADALFISRFSDLNLFIIRQKFSSKNVLSVIEELRKSKRMGNLGIIINDVNPSLVFGLKYGYGFGYGYSFGYGYIDEHEYYETSDHHKGIFTSLRNSFYKFLKKIFN